jgi:hypothetical protein
MTSRPRPRKATTSRLWRARLVASFVALASCASAPDTIERVSPRAIPGLQLWLDPSNGVSGSPLSLWSDQSRNHYDFFSSAPVWPTMGSGINGHATVDFDGTDFMVTDATLAQIVAPTGWTVFAVFRYTGSVHDAADVWLEPAIIDDTGGFWGMFADTQHLWGYGWDVAETKSAIAIAPGGSYCGYARFDGAELHVSVSRSPEISVVTSGELIDKALRYPVWLGRGGFATSGFFQGSIGDVAIWNRALTPEELGLMELYFTSKYGL